MKGSHLKTLFQRFKCGFVYRFSFLDMKEYNDGIDDDSQHAMVNGIPSIDPEDSGADTDSSGELLERMEPMKTNVKTAERISKD